MKLLKKKLQIVLAVYLAKLTSVFIRLLRMGDGVTLPGRTARIIDPDILSDMSSMLQGKIIAVMGTNGKTTTNSIIRHVLSAEYHDVISNYTGANMLNGIISAFVLAADWRGHLSANYACIEVDENASVSVLPQLKPDSIVVTNLSRDQLDRYGEVDIVRNKLKTAISSVPNANLILNGDDVTSYTLANECSNTVTTYGINEQIFHSSANAEIRESIFCRTCGIKLIYDTFYYGQLGIWHCPNCGAARPEPVHCASGIKLQNETYSFYVDQIYVQTRARAPYNVYNALAAYSALCSIHAEQKFAQVIQKFDFGNNREMIFTLYGSRVQLHLAKNPAGFQQKISFLLNDPNQKDVIIQINDTAQDGKDISWLWDVDFQYLGEANARSIYICGSRKYDMGLRLKYEDISHKFTSNIEQTIQDLAKNGTGNLYVIVNYSGLYQLKHILTKLQKGTNEP